jgi:hypothetical protein
MSAMADEEATRKRKAPEEGEVLRMVLVWCLYGVSVVLVWC